MNSKISVVLPSYNVSKYIENFVASLINQTVSPYEIIIVEDCSKDNTRQIAFELESLYPEVRVVCHEINKGLSEARNSGMDAATGEYILFLDSDDVIEQNLIEELVRYTGSPAMNNTSGTADATEASKLADIIVYGHSEDYLSETGEITYSRRIAEYAGSYEGSTDVSNLAVDLESNTQFGYAWNKCYRLKYLRDRKLRFQVIKHVEDVLFNVEAFRQADKVVVIEDVLYHYRNFGQQRLTSGYMPEYFDLQCRRFEALLSLTPEARRVSCKDYFRAMSSQVVRMLTHKETKDQIMQFCLSTTETDLYKQMAEAYAVTDRGRKERFLYDSFATGNFKSGIFRARLVAFVKNNMGGLFAKLKQR